MVASWLVRSTPERAVRVWALAGDIVLCSWARHFTLTVPLSTQVYKWVAANCWGNLTNCGGVTYDGLASRPGEVEILLAACYRNRDKHQQLWVSLASKAFFFFYWSKGRGKEKGGVGGELTFTGILTMCMYNVIITPTNMSNYLICMFLAVSVQ